MKSGCEIQMADIVLTFAVCTFNRAFRLPLLLDKMSSQKCTEKFEILIINNNSTDNTEKVVLDKMRATAYPQIRLVNEYSQGIVFARNRAIEESVKSKYLVFIDDDELPHPGYLQAVVDSFCNNDVSVVGGRIYVNFENNTRPKWLNDDLLKWLANVDYGNEPFLVKDKSTPLWTSNIAYNTKIFHQGLRFDKNYNRQGYAVGGGEDEIMFNNFIELKIPIMYQPLMITDHFVEPWRLTKSYFCRLFFTSGLKKGMFASECSSPCLLGVPRYIFRQLISSILKTAMSLIIFEKSWFDRALKVYYFSGEIWGFYKARERAS